MDDATTRSTTPAMPASANGVIARLAVEHCREAGVDPAPLIREAGLTAEEIGREHLRIGVTKQVALLNLAADALGDNMLGFHLAEIAELRQAGLIYFVLASSATLGDALRRAERYSIIANEGLCLKCLDGVEAGIRFSCTGLARHTDRHQIEFWATALVRMTRQLTGTRAVPNRVCLVHARCAGSGELVSFFGCPVTFSSDDDEVAYERGIGDHPVVGSDPYLNRMLVGYCEEALAQRARPAAALRTRIENAITPVLPHGRVRAADVARELGMSVRTMSRRLEAEAMTFSGILDGLRMDLARRYLAEPSLTVSQIAWLLGFQEVSAFTHAFRRWTGYSPAQARRANQRVSE